MKDKLEEKLGICGRLISGSKSGYRNRYPLNVAIFNSNLIVDGVKVWYGDIDITKRRNDLRELAVELDKDLIILYETDGRFEYENKPRVDQYVYIAKADGTDEIGPRIKDYAILGETLEWKKS